MDTRTKILSREAARGLCAPSPVVVTGYFDILRAEHARVLEEARRRAGNGTVVALVLPFAAAVFPPRARAEMAAAFRVIDYVVIGDDEDVTTLLEGLQPLAIVHLEADEERLHRELVQHVHTRQGR
jgi:glycerol-3-phosphate cytidylyltransferase-like family protein